MKIFADKNICGNNIGGHKIPLFLPQGLRRNIYRTARKIFYPQFFFIWAMTVKNDLLNFK
jgi:hypothetical protein